MQLQHIRIEIRDKSEVKVCLFVCLFGGVRVEMSRVELALKSRR